MSFEVKDYPKLGESVELLHKELSKYLKAGQMLNFDILKEETEQAIPQKGCFYREEVFNSIMGIYLGIVTSREQSKRQLQKNQAETIQGYFRLLRDCQNRPAINFSLQHCKQNEKQLFKTLNEANLKVSVKPCRCKVPLPTSSPMFFYETFTENQYEGSPVWTGEFKAKFDTFSVPLLSWKKDLVDSGAWGLKRIFEEIDFSKIKPAFNSFLANPEGFFKNYFSLSVNSCLGFLQTQFLYMYDKKLYCDRVAFVLALLKLYHDLICFALDVFSGAPDQNQSLFYRFVSTYLIYEAESMKQAYSDCVSKLLQEVSCPDLTHSRISCLK